MVYVQIYIAGGYHDWWCWWRMWYGIYESSPIIVDEGALVKTSPLHGPTTLDLMFSVTNSNHLCSILIVNCGIVLPTLNANPTLFVIPCKYFFLGGIIDVQCCNYGHSLSESSSKFQSSMTIFHYKLLTREGGVLANGWALIQHPWRYICPLIRKKCHPKSYHSDIKYYVTLNIISSANLTRLIRGSFLSFLGSYSSSSI